MSQSLEWIAANWREILIPVLVFLGIYLVGLWLRAIVYRSFGRWKTWIRWRGRLAIADTLRQPFMVWFLLLGAFVAVQISILSPSGKALAGRIIGSLFILSILWVAVIIGEKLIRLYFASIKMQPRPTVVTVNALRVLLVVIALLIILGIWGIAISPILLVIAAVVFVAGLALRDAIPSFIFGTQLASSKQMKIGDFIKLDSGESGQVTSVTWQNTQIRSIDGNTIIIPNSKMARTTVVNYGLPIKKAKDPFHFNTRLHLRELTGLQAANLTELLTILKEVPDSVVYYHVHHFLEEHLFLTPEPANDFAIWVNNTLGNDILAERLASIDTFGFPNIGALKQRLCDTIEDYLRNNPDSRRAPDEEEFHFIRSISFILPTPYVAHDLREFVEILRKVTIDSIYFHIYESRLRLQRGTNDFTIWIADNLGERELADKIASIDPYVYTLESLRNRIIERVENYIR